MRIVGLIPARGGSKSIPRKNILPLGEHPLIAYSIASSLTSKLIQKTIVSTDSPEIAEIAIKYGASVPFLRPDDISRDDSLDIEFFRHYLNFLKQNGEPFPDLMVHLRPTTPFRETTIVDAAISYMTTHPEATALRSANKTHLTPYKMFKRKGEFMEPFLHYPGEREFYNLPRQAFEDCFLPNGYVDVIRSEVILNTDMLHGDRIKLWETEPIADIDVLADIEHAKRLLESDKFSAIKNFLAEHL